MAAIVEKNVIVVGGMQSQFLGVDVKEFRLVPDSDSGARPDALRVTGLKDITLIIRGGISLRVEISSEGIFRERFLKHLTRRQRDLLSCLAKDLPGRVWPMAGKVLQKQVEKLGEEEIILALRNLFRGVEKVERGRKLSRRVPMIGRRLEAALFPVTILF